MFKPEYPEIPPSLHSARNSLLVQLSSTSPILLDHAAHYIRSECPKKDAWFMVLPSWTGSVVEWLMSQPQRTRTGSSKRMGLRRLEWWVFWGRRDTKKGSGTCMYPFDLAYGSYAHTNSAERQHRNKEGEKTTARVHGTCRPRATISGTSGEAFESFAASGRQLGHREHLVTGRRAPQ